MFSISAKAQINLVPNYSFEQFDTCPYRASGIDPFCQEWFTPMLYLDPAFNPCNPNIYGSSDYYNSCNNGSFGIPNNLFGYQDFKTGNAYAGFGLLAVSHPPGYPYHNTKEYIEVKLKSELARNREYCVEFYYSISEITYNYHPIAIEVLITDTIVKRMPHPLYYMYEIHANAQISSNLPVTIDSINWIKVSGSFIAKGGEKYITIGNFQNTDYIWKSTHYIFIDDVKLWYCDEDTMLNYVDSMIVPNVFTPNDDDCNDVFKFKFQEQWEYETQVFNRWGHLIFDNSNSVNWDGYYKSEKATPGVYYYVIQATAIKTGKVVVYRGTVTVLY